MDVQIKIITSCSRTEKWFFFDFFIAFLMCESEVKCKICLRRITQWREIKLTAAKYNKTKLIKKLKTDDAAYTSFDMQIHSKARKM